MLDKDWQSEIRLLEERKKIACQILGVSDPDDIEEIKQAWRKLCLKYHPDINDSSLQSHKMFILINNAYRCVTERKDCEQLDEIHSKDKQINNEKYMLDNPWGYFLWWRDKYFNK
jgi:DnaJ-class molecular chaperone